MPLPEAVTQAIAQAREALDRNPRSDLNRGYRHVIWAALGPRDEQGRHRRARLAIISAQRVLPIWERTWPKDRKPHEVLALAEHVLRGRADQTAAKRQRDEAFAYMDALSDRSRNKIPVSAGYSAVQALSTALWDEFFDPADINVELTDDHVDPEERDAAYFAALVSANGPPWDDHSDPNRRREFWEWWLREAVSAAWEQP